MPATTVADAANARWDRSFFGHPRGLATLFMTEMWERFSYYGMRALLIYYLTSTVAHGGLGFADSKAGAVYGLYTALVYLMALGGGWIADLFIGQQRAVLYGGILITAGEFCLMAPSQTVFYLGLVLLMAGTGFLKGNVSTIVGQLYSREDVRRDSGFSIFYMGINIGAFLSPIFCGYIGEHFSWRLGFGLCGVGMLAGLLQYALTVRYLGDAGRYPARSNDPATDRKHKRTAIVALSVSAALLALVGLLSAAGAIHLDANVISAVLGWCLLGISALVFAWLIFFGDWSAEERKRSAAILVLFVASALFWAAFEQAGSSLSLFAERNTNRHVPGFIASILRQDEFPASWYQFVQPLFVIILAPVFALLWLWMGKREPSSPAKFSAGLFFGGAAFVVMVPAAIIASGGSGTMAGPLWLVACYLFQTLGELCLSPVGLSAMTKLAPERAAGFMMGIWFLSISIGNWLAGEAASLYSSMPLTELFGSVAVFSIAAAVILLVIARPTVRLMGGVN
ncbi:MAG TPA: peptide MFS transporter [Bryobacteraceae bacterium]|jgi:POT family proton-dependent oligopeptide transporter|nr:peptide MFS transporter [Bryobacteraceae bacterium]